MKKRFRVRWLVNFALLILVVLLIVIAVLDKPEPVEPARQLGDYLPEKITEIRILRTGKNNIQFKLIDESWHMLSPYQARAEDSLIKRILSVSMLEVSGIIDDANIDKRNFGLQPPLVSIQFNQQLLNFGDQHAINKRRYIELENKIMLVPDQHVRQFKAGSVSYIDRHLIPKGMKVKGIHLDNRPVDPGKAENNFSRWLDTKASWISLAADANSAQGVTLDINLENGQRLHYLVENRESDIVLLHPEQMLEYHLPTSVAASLGITTPDSAVNTDTPADRQQTDQ